MHVHIDTYVYTRICVYCVVSELCCPLHWYVVCCFSVDRYFLRVFQGVLGIVVTTSDTEELSEDAKVR